MNVNEHTIHRFYTAFQKRDAATMNGCYDEAILFYDPVFENLVNGEVDMMWQMLLGRADDLVISFTNIVADEEYGTCDWEARYTFSATGRKIVNNVRAHMRFRDGRILEHTDQFNLYDWSKQAFGWRGWLLGWNPFFQGRIRKTARTRLDHYIEKSQSAS